MKTITVNVDLTFEVQDDVTHICIDSDGEVQAFDTGVWFNGVYWESVENGIYSSYAKITNADSLGFDISSWPYKNREDT